MNDWENLLGEHCMEDADDSGMAVSSPQKNAEDAQRRKRFDAGLKRIFTDGFLIPSRSPQRDLLRAIVENDAWFVAVKPDGSVDPAFVGERKYPPAIDARDSPPSTGKNKERRKQGKGGLLLSIYATAPERPTVQWDGRSLVRALREDIAGLLLHPANESPQELGREFFADLFALTESFDLEEMLIAPGPDQIVRLNRATWLVEIQDGNLYSRATFEHGSLVHVFTHRDRVGSQSADVVAMNGEQLFRMVATNDAVDGIAVNVGSQLGREGDALNGLVLSPGFVHRLLDGEDIRPGAQPLPARNRAEVELWLRFRHFPQAEHEWVETPTPERILVRVAAPQASEWRTQETLNAQCRVEGPTWSPVFTIASPYEKNSANSSEPPTETFDGGQTRILCAGLLAKELNADASGGGNTKHWWRVGRWFLLGRYMNDADRALARHRLALATELAKCLPPDADQIPRSALLTVEGAAFLRRWQHASSRSWIEATLQQADRFTKRWVWL
ncbi:MAG: hypothetical protein H8F28_19860 [Fibrella sp.]|nr:hypothetical protein [Armatimonadota bacterium]